MVGLLDEYSLFGISVAEMATLLPAGAPTELANETYDRSNDVHSQAGLSANVEATSAADKQ